jgi:hypothetical protein
VTLWQDLGSKSVVDIIQILERLKHLRPFCRAQDFRLEAQGQALDGKRQFGANRHFLIAQFRSLRIAPVDKEFIGQLPELCPQPCFNEIQPVVLFQPAVLRHLEDRREFNGRFIAFDFGKGSDADTCPLGESVEGIGIAKAPNCVS